MCNTCRYFEQREDVRGILGFSPLEKCVAALRQLAYGTSPDALDENLRMSARTARDSLHKFYKYISRLYGPQYLRTPTYNDIQQLYAHHSEVHGFPGMLGSLDCLHWSWGNCLKARQGQYTRGVQGEATIILEAVAYQDLWIWHAFFGTRGGLNDINVLNMSPIFNRVYQGIESDSSSQVHGMTYRHGYYLVDGFYPDRSILVKSFFVQMMKNGESLSERKKDVERAFGTLKKCFQILKRSSLFTDTDTMEEVMYTYIILHNMIIDDDGRAVVVYEKNEIIVPTVHVPNASQKYLANRQFIRNTEIHHNLRSD